MPAPNPVSPPQQPLPLFRAEAIAAQQHKFYGEILLIRPLSLALFFWLGIGISAMVLGFLLLGTYTEKIHVTGVFIQGQNSGMLAELYVPVRAIDFLHTGELIHLHCQSCSGQETRVGTVRELSKSDLSPEGLAPESKTNSQEPIYKVKLALLKKGTELPNEARLEADVPLGRKPLLRWLFERNSTPLREKEPAGN